MASANVAEMSQAPPPTVVLPPPPKKKHTLLIVVGVLVVIAAIVIAVVVVNKNNSNSGSQTCNGHGTANADGSCTCTGGYKGTKCETAPACGGHGTANSDGSCTCTDGYKGTKCETAPACGGHGTVNSDGSCTCTGGYTGTKCGTAPPLATLNFGQIAWADTSKNYRCLDVNSQDGTRLKEDMVVSTWLCNSASPRNRFFSYRSDGLIEFSGETDPADPTGPTLNSGYCIASTAAEAPLLLKTCNPSDNTQVFTYDKMSEQFILKARNAKECMDVFGGADKEHTPLITYPCKTTDQVNNQQFVFNSVSAPTPAV